MAAWIEEKFSPTIPFVMDDQTHKNTAAGLANQLMAQLDQRINSMPNDPDKFLMKGRLTEYSDALKVRHLSS